jgi:hypothetical protein
MAFWVVCNVGVCVLCLKLRLGCGEVCIFKVRMVNFQFEKKVEVE